ncbi:MAG: glutamate-5-semialdehyde dehydrogenase [Solirubrobacteraceae bacterium]|jgi:glutamate-5-semialdehyde dehydrogenase|nr:glutamate-5-semialdehyde dehydrogenase [Solirubrobacteraceae bacterium]
MAVTMPSVTDVCVAARAAARRLAALDSATKDAALLAIADALEQRAEEIVEANALDMDAGREAGLSAALLDRLMLDEARIGAIAGQVRDIAALHDPVGEVIEGFRLPNGLDVRKERVPLGVVAVVYEARPNVTIDAAALCLKSGNAIVLRGSSTAAHSNAVLAAIAAEHAPQGAVQLVGGGRDALAELARQEGLVDLIIPRGGEGLKAALREVATVPVIYAASGNCHVYVDAGADLAAAEAIVLNAKTQRPGVCNAAESLLVHAAAAPEFLPGALRALADAGVELRVDGRARALAGGALAGALVDATEEDWGQEFLALVLAVRVVDSVEEAIEHINTYGSGHSEAIVTRDAASARAFRLGVDAACVYVNASTRFTDGGEFGMGAEIGNSTQKLHARGPIGLRELCTFKYVVEGDGHIRP